MAKVSMLQVCMVCGLLAMGSAVFSGILVKQSYETQRTSVEDKQIQSGASQLNAVKVLMNDTTTMMKTTTESNTRMIRHVAAESGGTWLANPASFCSDINSTLMTAWFPAAYSSHQMSWSVTSLYPANAPVGQWSLAMAAQHYQDKHRDGSKTQYIAMPEGNGVDNHSWARRVTWDDSHGWASIAPTVEYNFSSFDGLGDVSQADWFTQMFPWVSSDNNAYWYFTHQMTLNVNGVHTIVQTMADTLSWWERLIGVALPNSEFVLVDNHKMVVADTIAEDRSRIATCTGTPGVDGRSCINVTADVHPVAVIREAYKAAYNPAWSDLTLPVAPGSQQYVTLQGTEFLVMTTNLYDAGSLRVTAIWLQPRAHLTVDTVTGIVAVVLLAILPTFIMGCTGIAAVLFPLAVVGATMTSLTRDLISLEEKEIVVDRFTSFFQEMDTIGAEFDNLATTCIAISKYIPRQIVRMELAGKLNIQLDGDDNNEDDEEDEDGEKSENVDEGSVNWSANGSLVGGDATSSRVITGSQHGKRTTTANDTMSTNGSIGHTKHSASFAHNMPLDGSGRRLSASHASNGVSLPIKRVAVALINLRASHLNVESFLTQYSKIVHFIETSAAKNKGILDHFHGDRFMLTFNALKGCAAMARSAALTCCQIVSDLKGLGMAAECGVSVGAAHIGQLGSNTAKKFSVVSRVVSQADFLMRQCRVLGNASILMPLAEEVQSAVYYYHTRLFTAPDGGLFTGMAVVRQRPPSAVDEWMYELESSEKQNPFAAINKAASMLLESGGNAVALDAASTAARLAENGCDAECLPALKEFQMLLAEVQRKKQEAVSSELGTL